MSDEYPFQGLRVIDASQGIGGPTAAMLLARYGADVIKVEPLDGDWSRHRGYNADRIGIQAAATNLGKRSIALDLKRSEGAAALRRLLENADIFLESFRPGVIQRLGFDYDAVKAIKNDIVYLSVSGYGQNGPWREKGSIDSVMQAFSGLMSGNLGAQDKIPHRVGFFVVDITTGLCAFQAISVALYARRESGHGRYIDCSLLKSATMLQSMAIIQHSTGATGESTLSSCPLGTFPTRDGWINLAVTKDHLWPPFCHVIGRDDLGQDPALATRAQRVLRNADITAAVSEALARDDGAVWQGKLAEIGVMNERVNDYGDLLRHPQTEAINAVSWIEQPHLGRVAVANLPGAEPLQSDTQRAIAPLVGSHTREILAELGYADAEIAGLLNSGAFKAA